MRILVLLIVASSLFLSVEANAEKAVKNQLVSAVSKSQCEEVGRLLAAGVSSDTRFTDYQTKVDTTLIYMAIGIGDVCTTKALISYGANLNHIFQVKSRDPIWIREKSPLSAAIGRAYQTKRLEIVKALLESGARSDLAASDGVRYVEHIMNNLKSLGKADQERERVVRQIRALINK